MRTLFSLWSTSVLVAPLLAQAPPPRPKPPVLEPGEGLAVGASGGDLEAFGEARSESPMGGLAELPWLRLEGSEWSSRMLTFKCTGAWSGQHCWSPKGHGRVDVAKATHESCHLAYLSWARFSAGLWKETYGPAGARTRLEEVFRPFLGDRLPRGEELPEITPAWVGDGDLLRTSPEAFARWLLDLDQDQLLEFLRRSLMANPLAMEGWWFAACHGTGESASLCTWAVASDGRGLAVLRLPKGRPKAEAIARLKALMAAPAK